MGVVVSSTDGRDQERDLPASIAAGAPDSMGTVGFVLANFSIDV